jgi:small-conductance mechanosensitive channel
METFSINFLNKGKSMSIVQAAFVTPDGKVFATKKEAQDHVRLPKIREALNKLTKNNAELVDWLIANQETVEMAFETGTIRRVSKVEHGKLAKALKAVEEAGNPKFAFVVEHAQAIMDSFRWPSVKRMTDEEKATAARNTLAAASEGNEELAEWILTNKEAVLEAFEAGIEKRQIPPKAAEALAAYRAKMAAEKKAKEAA